MNRTAFAIGISLAAGFAAAAIVFTANRPVAGPAPEAADEADSAAYFDQSAATEDRIRALEAAVAQERNARLLLEEELQALYAEIEELGNDEILINEQISEDRATREQIRGFREQRSANTSEDRRSQLVDAGFSPDQAEWIVRRESELQMEAMQAVFEARQSGEPITRSALDPGNVLRQELGDSQYEQYLEATGRPTSVSVGAVLESSPGQRAGLQVGDEIVSYGGERVFSYSDLSDATMTGESGQTVVVDIVRDGIPMQLVIDSGPIGISNRNFAISIRR